MARAAAGERTSPTAPRPSPLQNRVDPFGALDAVFARGLFMGNRGGRFHRPDCMLGPRRFAGKAWICCRLQFKDRQRAVWGDSYTELFFLDDPTALAAGHRPCFECRRQEAIAFAEAWSRARRLPVAASAGEIDAVLHAERIVPRGGRRPLRGLDRLPDGAVVALEDAPATAYAVRDARLLPWSHHGYGKARRRPTGIKITLLTPPSIVAALAAGYRPHWHPSADSDDVIG